MAYEGSGVEHIWKNKTEFIEQFSLSQRTFWVSTPPYKEHSLEYRLKFLVNKKLKWSSESEQVEVINSLKSNFWRNYRSQCYVSEEVRRTLEHLRVNYNLLLISNLIVEGGIEDLLNMTGLENYFNIVLTSIGVGWKKPHPSIYKKALERADVLPEDTIFVGDDLVNDYVMPSRMGFRAYLYDRQKVYSYVDNRFSKMSELIEII